MEKLQELLGIFEASGLSEIEIEEEGIRVRLKKSDAGHPVSTAYPVGSHVSSEVAGTVPAAPTDAAPQDQYETINSPMVGVFYAAPAPDQPPFVRSGDIVQEHQTLCIVEAMKLMNEVAAQFPAKIIKVLAENGEPVEFGQPLFAVEPLD